LKILKKLRTANLNSEFTGSYKKSAVNLYSPNPLKKLNLAHGKRQ